MKPVKVGIIGGLGPAATILYYRRLIEGLRKLEYGKNRPDFIIYSLDSKRIQHFYNRDATHRIVDNLVESLTSLENVGCDFGIIACSTAHLFIDSIQPRINLPTINLIDTVVERIRKSELDSVGLLGTTITMGTSLNRAPLEEKGIKVLIPSESDREWIGNAISNDFQRQSIPIASLDKPETNNGFA